MQSSCLFAGKTFFSKAREVHACFSLQVPELAKALLQLKEHQISTWHAQGS